MNRIEILLGYKLAINNDEDLFTVFSVSNTKSFNRFLIEKDFYLTILLSYIAKQLPEIHFKGGTCLNKVYFPYFRLSEDLDFTLSTEAEFVNSNSKRQKFAYHMREKMQYIATTMGRTLNAEETQHRKAQGNIFLKHKHYTYLKYVFTYTSIYDQSEQTIKVELTYTHKQYLPTNNYHFAALFMDPVLDEALFPWETIECLALEEMMAEKVRAALTRKEPAIRDFFDIWYVQNNGFDFLTIQELINTKITETEGRWSIDGQYPQLQEQIGKHLMPVLGNNTDGFNLQKIYDFILTLKPHILNP